MSRAIEQMVESLFDKGREEYLTGFMISYKRAMCERGNADGLVAAEGAMTTDPDAAELQKAASEYATSFVAGYKRGLKARGDQDGLDAAVSASVDGIDPKPNVAKIARR